MSYSAGQTITDDDYNIFATGDATGTPNHTVPNVNSVWGTGDSATLGYGQPGDLAQVNAGATITATQWSNLLNRVSTLASHQGTTITSITNPSVGNTIEAYAALQTNVNAVYNNRLNGAAFGTSSQTVTSRTTSWKVQVTMTQTVTFASADDMRTYFNAGGIVQLSFSRSGGTSHAKNTGWSSLCTACGTITLSSDAASKTLAGTTYTGTTKTGGSGTPNILRNDIGYHQLTSTDTAIFRQYDTSTNYTANYITVNAKVLGNVLTLTTIYTDAAADEAYNPGLDTVDGTLSTTIIASPPSTSYIANSWGTPVLAGSETGS